MTTGFARRRVLALMVVFGVSATAVAGFADWTAIRPAIAKVGPTVGTVVTATGAPATNVKVVNFGTTVYTGSMNVKVTLDRVRANSPLPEKDDGSVFTNSERKLPVKSSGYYREFVHWPATSTGSKLYGSVTFPGPMRIVLGQNGEVYFTGDHYSTFWAVK